MRGLIKPDTIRVSDLLKCVSDAEYVLPRFQRGFEWVPKQIVELLDSIYEQIPIGIFLLWDSDQLGKAFRYIGDVTPIVAAPKRHSKYVLDGQQRLTSLLFALKPDGILLPGSITEKYQILFSIDDEKFYIKKCPKGNKCFPADILGSDERFIDFYANNSKKINKSILDNLNAFRNYEIPLLTFDETVSLDVVSKTFQYLNAKGTPLTLINLIAAKTYAPEAFDLYQHIDETKHAIEEAGFFAEDFTGEVIIRALAIYNGIDNHPKTIIEKLKTEHFVKDYKKSQRAYIEALVFIEDDIGIPLRILPYDTMLIPLTTFLMRKYRDNLSASEVGFIKQWFWRACLNSRYGSEAATMGIVDTRVLSESTDLKNVTGLNRPTFTIDDFIEAPSGSALGKSILGLLQARKPLDLSSNIDLKLKGIKKRKKLIKNIDKHHIFPKDYLKTKLRGSNKLLMDSVCNLAWISTKTNLIVSNTPPSRYFKKLEEINKDFKFSAEQQFIPVGTSSPIWANNYKKFLKVRAEFILKEAFKRCGF